VTTCVRGLIAAAFSAAAGEVAAFFAIAMTKSNHPAAEVVAPPAAQEPPREAWRSEELLGERTEVLIWHNGEAYRLRRTRQGKLILYK